MNCELCSENATFFCSCTTVYLCQAHIGGHLMIEAEHQMSRLSLILNPTEDSILIEEIKTRSKFLKELKKKILLESERLLLYIRKKTNESLRKIDEEIIYYQGLIKTKVFEKSMVESIKNIMKTKIVNQDVSSENIFKEVDKYFLKKGYFINTDYSKDKRFLFKKFIQTHCGSCRALSVSENGEIALTGSDDSTVRVWNIKKNQLVFSFYDHFSCVQTVSISKDGSLGLSGGLDRQIILFDLRLNTLVKKFQEVDAAISSLTFSKDESFCFISTIRPNVLILKRDTFNLMYKINSAEIIYAISNISKIELLFTSRHIVEKFNIKTLKITCKKTVSSKSILSMAISSATNFVSFGSEDGIVKIYYISLVLYSTYDYHSLPVTALAFTSDSKFALSGGTDGTICIYDITNQICIQTMSYHQDAIFGLHSNDNIVLSVSREGLLGISDLNSGKLKNFLSLKPFNVGFTQMKGKYIAFGSLNNVIVFESSGKEIEFLGHVDHVFLVALSTSNSFLVSGSRGNIKNLLIWDFKSQKITKDLTLHNGSVFALDISFDEINLISGDYYGELIYWSLTDYSVIHKFQAHQSKIFSVKLLKNKSRAVTGGNDCEIMIWNMIDAQLESKVSCHKNPIMKICLTADERFVVSGGGASGVRVVDMETLEEDSGLKTREELLNFLDKENIFLEMIQYIH